MTGADGNHMLCVIAGTFTSTQLVKHYSRRLEACCARLTRLASTVVPWALLPAHDRALRAPEARTGSRARRARAGARAGAAAAPHTRRAPGHARAPPAPRAWRAARPPQSSAPPRRSLQGKYLQQILHAPDSMSASCSGRRLMRHQHPRLHRMSASHESQAMSFR